MSLFFAPGYRALRPRQRVLGALLLSGVMPALTSANLVDKAPQTLTRTATYGSGFTVSWVASSGLPVAISASGACTGSGSGAATITMTSGTGVCVLHYRQAGDEAHASAETREELQALRAPQAIQAAPVPAAVPYAAAFGVSATAASGLPVAISAAGVCAGSGSGAATLTMTAGVGTCTLRFSQGGDENFLPAADLIQTLAASPAVLTVTPSPADASRQYSDANPSFVPAYAGFAEGDGVGVLTEAPACATTAAPDSPPGLYPVTCTGGQAANYVFHHGDAVRLRVTPEDATVVPDRDNPAALRANVKGQYTWKLTLGAALKERRPDVGQFGTAAGDITTAGFAAALSPLQGGEPNPLRCRPGPALAPREEGRRSLSCTAQRALDVGVYEFTGQAAGNYEGLAYDALTVFDRAFPWPHGGGWFDWPVTRDRTRFGFVLKHARSERDLQGQLLVVRHHADGRFSRLRSESVTGVVLGGGEGTGCGTVTFSGKATYTFWDPGLDGGRGGYASTSGNPFMAYAEDCDHPGGGRDHFLIRGGGELDMPMDVYAHKVPLAPEAGDIVVPHPAAAKVP